MTEPPFEPVVPDQMRAWPGSGAPTECTLHPVVGWLWAAERLVMLGVVAAGAAIAAIVQREFCAQLIVIDTIRANEAGRFDGDPGGCSE